MDLTVFLWTMGAGTILALVACILVLFRVDPDEAGIVGHILFYLTLFATLAGTFCILGTVVRVHFGKHGHLVSRIVKISFRHALMLAFVCVVSLALSAISWLRWWNVLLQFVCMASIEYVFLIVQDSQRG